jgi:hypothetical protein
MGMDLVSKSGATFDLSGGWWWFYLTLAERYGWQPKGTGKPDHLKKNDKWSGGYDSCDGQMVDGDDARALGSALAKVLLDPDSKKVVDSLLDEWWASMQDSKAYEGLSEDMAKKLRAALSRPEFSIEFTQELVDLCSRGEFRIE